MHLRASSSLIELSRATIHSGSFNVAEHIHGSLRALWKIASCMDILIATDVRIVGTRDPRNVSADIPFVTPRDRLNHEERDGRRQTWW